MCFLVRNSRGNAWTLHDFFDPVWDFLPVDPPQSNILDWTRSDDLSGCRRHLPSQSRCGNQSLGDCLGDGEEFRHGGCDHHFWRFRFRHGHGDGFHLWFSRRTPLIDWSCAQFRRGTVCFRTARLSARPTENREEIAKEIRRLSIENSGNGLDDEGANHNKHEDGALVHDGRMDELRYSFTSIVHDS